MNYTTTQAYSNMHFLEAKRLTWRFSRLSVVTAMHSRSSEGGHSHFTSIPLHTVPRTSSISSKVRQQRSTM